MGVPDPRQNTLTGIKASKYDVKLLFFQGKIIQGIFQKNFYFQSALCVSC